MLHSTLCAKRGELKKLEKWRNKDEFTKKKFERDPYGAAIKERRGTAQNETEMTGLPKGSRQHFLIFLVKLHNWRATSSIALSAMMSIKRIAD